MCSAAMYDWCVRSDVLGGFVRLDGTLGAKFLFLFSLFAVAGVGMGGRCLWYKRKCPEKVQRCVVLSHQLLPEKSKGPPCVIAAAGSVCALSLSTGGCGQSDRVSPHTVLGCLWWTGESLEDNT